MADIDILVGRTITEVVIALDKESVEFVTPDERYYFEAHGDCCSNSWIESIEWLDNLIGEEVISCNEHYVREDVPDDHPFSENDCLKFYNVEIITKKGICAIDFRNQSNGYYDGELYFIPCQSILNETTLKQLRDKGYE